MSKFLSFVFALAILSASIRSEFVPFDKGSPVPVLTGKGRGIPDAPDRPAPQASKSGSKNPYESLVTRLAQKVSGLTSEQMMSANAIINELDQQLTSANQPENKKLAAYLLATAYSDTSLLPTEEQLATDSKAKFQVEYFKQGFQGRGFVHFTGAYNYNRLARDINVAINSNPKLLMDSKVAAKVLVFGALNGHFTGIKLTNFIPSSGAVDFVGARRAINGDINAVSIAKLATDISN